MYTIKYVIITLVGISVLSACGELPALNCGNAAECKAVVDAANAYAHTDTEGLYDNGSTCTTDTECEALDAELDRQGYSYEYAEELPAEDVSN